jgi:dihydroorotase
MKTLLVKGGRVIDPASGLDQVTDILIEGTKIKQVGKLSTVADAVVDATGKIVVPGLIDMHVHLREPGKEEEETIASGAAAAVAGGIATACCMPNTDPAVDNEASAEFVFLQAERAGLASIYPIGAVTKGRQGKELAEIGQLSRGGAVAFSDDGDPVSDAEVMRRALEYAKMFNKSIISHCEDRSLSAGGIMHEGYVSTVLGLRGIPAASEEVTVSRDLILAKMTGGKLHIAHVSTAGSVELLRRAKQQGVKVTAEATPHHLSLTDECLKTFNTNFKVNPPLRTRDDVEAVKAGLKDGTIDCIVSDHAPHAPEEKDVELEFAPFGMIGMETMLGIVINDLIASGLLSWLEAMAKLTVVPARILDIPKGTLALGADADVTIIDPELVWTVNPDRFRSKSRNCPFMGRQLKGKATMTIVGGEIKFRLDE